VGAAGRNEGDPKDVVGSVRQILWRGVGLVRDEAGLQEARRELAALEPAADGSRAAANALTVSALVVEAALARPESRGAHYRRDHPQSAAHGVRRVVRPLAEPTVEVSTAALTRADATAGTRAA
jgi:L-aspartate oxidase